MRSRVALLALLVIALMTAPGLRAEFARPGQSGLASREDRLTLPVASKRLSLKGERRGGASRQGHSKGGSPALLLPVLPAVWLSVSSLERLAFSSLRSCLYAGSCRARAPPLAA